MNDPFIYHITTKEQWAVAQRLGRYESGTLGTEGFTHCSREAQVAGVLDRYYKGKTGLIKLRIALEKVTAPVRFEIASSVNEAFPHIYGPLNLDAVVETIEL